MLLSLDTSSHLCSACLYDEAENKFHFACSENIGKGHSEHLLPMLESELKKTNYSWQDIKRISVVRGPGSFTGLRVGLACAKALALALNVPCNGVSVFEVLAFSYGGGKEILCLLKAKQNKIAVQHFNEKGEAIGKAKLIEKEKLKISCFRFAGAASVEVAEMFNKQIEILYKKDEVNIKDVARFSARLPVDSNPPEALYLEKYIL